MGKTGIIIWREYMTRVKNKTFIIMCFLAPMLVAGTFFLTQELSKQIDLTRRVVIVDETVMPDSLSYAYVFHDTDNLRFNFKYVHKTFVEVSKIFKDSVHTSILLIPSDFNGVDSSQSIGAILKLKSQTDPGTDNINLLQNMISVVVQGENMRRDHIPRHAMDVALRKVSIANEITGKNVSANDVQAYVGLGFGLIIYMYILMFGVQIMRSVVEEKMTRIVEVIVSSVKPFQLMLGKIIGVTMVGITQFLIWIILTFAVVTPIIHSVQDKYLDINQDKPHQMKTAVIVTDDQKSILTISPTEKTEQVVTAVLSIPWGNLIPAFLFYFLFGYFLYASIFAAIGSAADVDADTQQFTLPITIPLMIAIFSFGNVLNDPNGTVAKWLSMIPFTSPIVMLLRIPFGGVTIVELLISFAILIVTFLFFTFVAGRIYRVGILMYGKKASWKELGKWIFYKA